MDFMFRSKSARWALPIGWQAYLSDAPAYSELDAKEELLPSEENDSTRQRGRIRDLVGYILVVSLLCLNLVGLSVLLLRPQPTKYQPPQLAYSLAEDAVRYEQRTIDTRRHVKNPYNGPPSQASDYAWHVLLQNTNIKVPLSVLEAANRTSVPVGDNSGYFVIPDVYHQLHCLKSIRQWIYRDYYGLEELPTTIPHIDHCIDNLRQNIMCHGDMTLLTFDWADWTPEPIPYFVQDHTCVNFQAIDAWASEFVIDIMDEKTIVHPTLGPSYRGLAQSHIGGHIHETVKGFEGVVVNKFGDETDV